MIEEDWKKRRTQIGTVVCDDDTTMKKILRHRYNDLVSEGKVRLEDWPINNNGERYTAGELSYEVPEPKFLTDFNHWVKSVGKVVCDLASKPKRNSRVDKNIAKRLKLYWSKMLNQTQHLNIESNWNKIQQRGRAPVEHIFNNHQLCDKYEVVYKQLTTVLSHFQSQNLVVKK